MDTTTKIYRGETPLDERARSRGTDHVTLIEMMKRAVYLRNAFDCRDVADEEYRYEVTGYETARYVLEILKEPIPPVVTGWIEGDPVFDGKTTAAGQAKRTTYQSVAKPNADDDGATITCTGPCAERKPITKFPTLKKGGRGSVCRDCEKVIRAERKGS